MHRITVKNTFISCEPYEEEGTEQVASADAGCKGNIVAASPRARSVGCLPLRRSEDEQRVQIERLNKILESDLSPREAISIPQSPTNTEGLQPFEQKDKNNHGAPSPEELKELHHKLQNLCTGPGPGGGSSSTLAEDGNSAVTVLSASNPFGFRHIGSNCSLSSMGAESSVESELPPLGSRLREVWSTNSLSTMDSNQVDIDNGEVEFDLTIEEQAQTQPQPDRVRSRRHSSPAKGALVGMDGSSPKSPGSKKKSSHPQAKDYRHGNVPKNVNLKDEYSKLSPESPPTTLMIRNIPNRYSQRELIAELEELGFAGTFDFLYVPLDKGTMSNVGYAFVNFVDPSWAKKCFEDFQNHRFKHHRRVSSKVAAVSVAHIQGLEANLAHYKHAAVNSAKMKQLRPVIMANISKALSGDPTEEEPNLEAAADSEGA